MSPHACGCVAETSQPARRRRHASCASALPKSHLCGPSSIAAVPRGLTCAAPTASWPWRKRGRRPREAASRRSLPIPRLSRRPLIGANPPPRRLTTGKRATAISSSARGIPRGSPCASQRRPHARSPAANLSQDLGLWGMGRRASKGLVCTRCWGCAGLRLHPTLKAADAPPWQSEDGATSPMMCGSLGPQAHRERPPRRERPGSGSRRHGSTPASGWDPPPQGDAGAGAVIGRRTSMHPCAGVKCSAMDSSCVRPQIGPEAIHRPASGPGAG